jgi:hypothetical protein
VFLKLSVIADHFIGGRRMRGNQSLVKFRLNQKRMQVNRGKIIPVVKITNAVLAHMYGRIFH